MKDFDGNEKEKIMPFAKLTKVQGPVERHLEALWAEIKSLKERLERIDMHQMKILQELEKLNREINMNDSKLIQRILVGRDYDNHTA